MRDFKRAAARPSLFLLIAIILAFSITACDRHPEAQKVENTPMPGFDLAGSDARAIAIADEVMEACGGRANWDNTRYLTWRCLGKRLNVWDKRTGNIRVESRRSTILMNLNTMQGRAWKDGVEITEPDALQRALRYGYEAWVNDSYWVFLPFKLKDPGVTLKYLGEGETPEDRKADILSLTFKNVGVTPNNKFHVYIDKESKLLVRWEFYLDASDPTPRFSTPWGNYKKYGDILLSDDRGQKAHRALAVLDELPASVFASSEPTPFSSGEPILADDDE